MNTCGILSPRIAIKRKFHYNHNYKSHGKAWATSGRTVGDANLDKLLEHVMKSKEKTPVAIEPKAPQKVKIIDKAGNIATPWDKDAHAWEAKGWTRVK